MKTNFRRIIFIAVILGLLASVFSLGIDFGRNIPKNIVIKNLSGTESKNQKDVDFSAFWQAWSVIDEQFLNAEKIDNQKRVYGAIAGLVHSLGDPHTEFFNPEDGKKFEEDIQGNFGGIGAEIGTRDDHLTVISPLKGSPAEKAGLKPKDIILAINTSSTENLNVEEAIGFIRGEIGSKVTLTIFRDGWEKPRDFAIVRENIVIPTLEFEMKEGNIAYIRLDSFNANANLLFYKAIVQVLSNGSKGIVLDLRNDPGGYLQVAVDIAGWFLPRGTLVVKEVSKKSEEQKLFSSGNASLKDFPVVILVNSGSASASEILAGALRDHRGIKLIGETTFGKGTVQQIETLKDGSSIKITVANWVLPKGGIIEGKGLTPDYEIKLSDDDIDKDKDPQFDKAIEILKSEIKKNNDTLFKLDD